MIGTNTDHMSASFPEEMGAQSKNVTHSAVLYTFAVSWPQ